MINLTGDGVESHVSLNKIYLKNIEDPLPGFMIRNKYKRSLVKSFKKTMSFRQTELLSSTDKNV